jgi:hypothetical protein
MNTPRAHLKTVIASTKMSLCLMALIPCIGQAQAWRDCVPNSMGPGGCESMGPGGGLSMGPGGGQSMGPGGGLSMGPGGGQSMGPGGGLSMGPGGGLAIDRDRSRGLDTRTMRPFPPAERLYRP